MAVSPLRALLTAHLQASWNRTRKQMGRGVWAAVVLLTVLFVTAVLPLLGGAGAAGYAVMSEVQRAPMPLFSPILAVAITVGVLGLGFLGGVSSGSRQLPWETLRAFPLTPRALFTAELVSGAGELITMIEVLGLSCFLLGAAIAAPQVGPWLLLLWLSQLVTLLAFQQLVGSLAQRFVRRLRWAIVLLPLVFVVPGALAAWLAENKVAVDLEPWGQRLERLSRWFPLRATTDALEASLRGTSSPSGLAWGVLAPLLSVTVVVVLSYFAVSREKPLVQDAIGGKRQRLWSFNTQTMGIARLQLTSLAGSIPGRMGLVMPILTLFLIRGPLAQVMPGRGWNASIAFAYASLASTNLLFNQFGLDRHGVKVLFLLPIEAGALLKGKLLGFAAWQALQASMLLVLLVLAGQGKPHELVTGLLLGTSIFLIFAMVGQFVSLWSPRPLRQNGMRAAQPPVLVVIVQLGTMLTVGALLFGTLWVVRSFWPAWEIPALVLVTLVLGALVMPVTAFNTLVLQRSREKLVEVLGATGE